MQIRTVICMVTLILVLPLMANRAVAQSQELIANVPFDFTACRQQLPAGKYKLRPMTTANPNLVLVRNEDNSAVEILCTHNTEGTKRVSGGKLIFNRYGNQYFLSEVWFAGERTGNELAKSEAEEALLRELKPPRKKEKVTVKVTEAKPN